MNIEGDKFSKSRNHAIWLPDILERYQPDAIRYYVARTLPETTDSDFSWDGFFSRVNNELLAAWGNLVNRVTGFSYKRYDGAAPVVDHLLEEDEALIARIESGFDTVGKLIEQVKLLAALNEAMGLVREVNVYLDHREPWKRIKEDVNDAGRSIYTALRAIDNLKTILAPWLPFSAQQVHEILGYDGQVFGDMAIHEYAESERKHRGLVYDAAKQSGKWEKSSFAQGQKLREPKALYIKLDESIIEQERSQLGQTRQENPIIIE